MSTLFYEEYCPIFVLSVLAFVISCIFFGASFLFSIQNPDTEKASAYECGFDPYEDARNAFDIRFYVIAILFIIFDLEAIFLFPWVISIHTVGAFGFWVMIDFLIELIVGFIYAWNVGALEWE